MTNVISQPPLSFDVTAFGNQWFQWATVEACFWPGRGQRSERINPKLAPIGNRGGVYLLAYHSTAPESIGPKDEHVWYVGQTNAFKRRLGEFANSAGFLGERKAGHSASWRWPEGEKNNTWVAFYEIGMEFDQPHLATAMRCWMEGIAIEEYRIAHGTIPKINEAVGVDEQPGQ
jgi:hypothetical protein